MANKKDLIIVVLVTFCLTSTLFAVVPTRSSQATSELGYDPWADIDDNGIINEYDIYYLVLRFMETGEPINKTDLLLQLQSRIDSLNGSVSSLIQRVNALEANYSVTNLKLAPNAIPFNSVYSTTASATSEMYSWIDMSDMSMSITLNRTSHVLIMWGGEANQDDWRNTIYIRALVGGNIANPSYVTLTPIVHDVAGHTHPLDYSVYSYNFYLSSVATGTYTIKIQWNVSGGVGRVWHRTLTVVALPA